jgi:ribosomal small subunit protein bTHX
MTMGRGDIKTAKGKRTQKSYGNSRPQKVAKKAPAKKK